MKESKIVKSIFSVTGVLILAKIMGFIKQMVTASVFGATAETDLINLSQELVANIEFVLTHTVTTAFVAVYIKVKQQQKEEGNRLISDTLKVATLGVAALVLLVLVGSPIISRVIAPTYSYEKSALLASYIRYYAPVLLLFSLTSILTGILNAHERFVPGQLSGLFLSVITIVSVLCLNRILGVDALMIGFWGYAMFNFIFVGVVSKQYWHYETGNPLNNRELKNLLFMMGPLFVGYAMIFINQQIDKIIVSGMEPGTVTAMSYASVLSNLVCTLTGAACAVLFTHMAVKTSSGNHKDSADLALRAAIILITSLLPITLITITKANDLIAIAFGRGAFQDAAIKIAGMALMGYGLGFVPYAMKTLYGSFQYGKQDTKNPMINTSIGITVNIAFSIILSRFIGVLGVTIASSFSEMVAGVLNMRIASKHSEYVNFKKLRTFIPAWLLGSILCVVAVIISGLVYRGNSHLVSFILATFCGIIGYLLGVAPWFIKYKHMIPSMIRKDD